MTDTTTDTIYYADTSKGRTYYFAGAPTDNWVYFGGFYWRIIRINENGSIRMIYNGTSTATTGTSTVAMRNRSFNSDYSGSEYVGFKYTSGQQHGQGTESFILYNLKNCYRSSGLSGYSQYIDSSVGFCNDRNMASGSSWSSQPSSAIYYATYERLITNKSPSFTCISSDLMQEPVGLITADEVAFAGGVYGTRNRSFYLYSELAYWTMSPSIFAGLYSYVLYVSSNSLDSEEVNTELNIRPVINLSSNVTITGSGTSTDPYTVVS